MRGVCACVCALLLTAVAQQDDQYIAVVELWPEWGRAVAAAAGGGKLQVEVSAVEPGEAAAAAAALCAAAGGGAAAALGAAGEGGAGASRDLATAAARAGLPLLALGPVPAAAARDMLALYPPEDDALEAVRDIVIEKGWEHAVLLYASSARAGAALAADQLVLTARQIPPQDPLLRDLLLVLKKEGHVNFVVWSDAPTALRVLDAAQRVGLLAERHSYVTTSLEVHTLPLHDYSYGGANITGLMAFDPETDSARELSEKWRAEYAAWLGDPTEADDADPQPEETEENEEREETEEGKEDVGEEEAAAAEAAAGGVDKLTALPTALLLAAEGTRLVEEAIDYLQLEPIGEASCDTGVGAFHAETLLNYIRSEERANGWSWDASGSRVGTALQVAELSRGGALQPVASWRRGAGLLWRPRDDHTPPPPGDSMTNRTFDVLIALNKPYVMRKESVDRLSGNDRYEGFCIELIEELAKQLNFTYNFIEGPSNYDLMLDYLVDKGPAADMLFAITDLTITAARERLVDFTTPFMNLGISILFHTPTTPEPKLFGFLLPFSNGVWLCLGFAYLATSLVLYVVGRVCPEEWQNPYPCIEEPPALENQFTLGNALWFNLGAVLLQGSEIAPVAYGSRAVASSWWLFALVITSSYTANLATLLAKKASNELIKNVDDLANNELGITYGAKATGATITFFKESQNEVYQKMYQHMQTHDLPSNNDEGIKRVQEGNFAFMMESTSIEYVVERVCDVTQVGDLLDSKGYGIAMKKGSPYRQALNLALLRLQERGRLREMKHSWWKERNGGGACKEQDEIVSARMDMKNFRGLFLVLVVGCALGVVVSCCDLAALTWRQPRDPSRSFRHNFAEELRFVFSFDLDAKPLEGPLIPSKSPSARSSAASEVEEAEGEGEGEPEAEAEAAAEAATADAAETAIRSGSAQSAPRRRRRSSIHHASVRLARHARDRD